MDEPAKCELCGEPMPPDEEMFLFKFHNPCPKVLPKKRPAWIDAAAKECAENVSGRDDDVYAETIKEVFVEIIERHAKEPRQ